MTKPVISTDPRDLRRGSARRQRGDALLEAIMGILLMAIVGLGLSYAAARALNSQRYQSTHTRALAEMRNALTSTGVTALCAGPEQASVSSLDDTKILLPVPTCEKASVTVGVAGKPLFNVTLPAGGVVTGLRLSTPSNNETIGLFGGDGILTVSQ